MIPISTAHRPHLTPVTRNLVERHRVTQSETLPIYLGRVVYRFVIDFHIERGTVPPYLQIVQQVKQALRLGWLEPGDKLPKVHEVAAESAVNSNTVLKAYKELEREGLATGRPGQGTFIVKSLTQLTPASYAILRRRLAAWIAAARKAGLDSDGMEDLFAATVHELEAGEIA